MLVMSFTNAVVNHRLIFFNNYIWTAIAPFSVVVSIRALKIGPNLYENSRLHNTLACTLLILGILSLIFIIITAFLPSYMI